MNLSEAETKLPIRTNLAIGVGSLAHSESKFKLYDLLLHNNSKMTAVFPPTGWKI